MQRSKNARQRNAALHELFTSRPAEKSQIACEIANLFVILQPKHQEQSSSDGLANRANSERKAKQV